MRASLELFLGLLSRRPARVGHEDFAGPHGGLLLILQGMGVLAREPGVHPVPGCPHCGEGTPYALRGRTLCNRCASSIDPRHLLLWPLDAVAFLRWLAQELGLRGEVQAIDESLYQLGTWGLGTDVVECFYRVVGPLSDSGRARLEAYRSALVLYGLTPPPEADRSHCRCLSLLELLRMDGPPRVPIAGARSPAIPEEPGSKPSAGSTSNAGLAVGTLDELLRPRGNVRFDAHTGALWAGDGWLGEVPLGSKEFYFLDALARSLDRFVPYPDLKREVLHRSGGGDVTEEATFCQGLKSRIKKRWIPKIDRLIATTNKADGYRLRGYAEL